MNRKMIYLDTYVFQKDNRIRLPKGVVENLEVDPGTTCFDIFIETESGDIVLRKNEERKDENK